MLTLRDVIRGTRGQLVSGYPATECGRVSIDTRTLQRGDVFFALQGPHHDGHHYLNQAAEKGASALVVHRLDPNLQFDHRPMPDLVLVSDTLVALQSAAKTARAAAGKTRVIGLTGSNGKTTTKEMLAGILRLAGKTLATRGNLNNHIGLPLVLTELTPEHQFAVVEMGTSMKGDMDVLVGITQPEVGLITNVGMDHLEYLKTPEGVLAENRKLFDALPKDGIAVVNLEDPLLRGLVGHLHCKIMTYGRTSDATVRVAEILPLLDSIRFKLFLGQEECVVTLNGVGEVQVWNAMAAAATALALDIPSRMIVKGLEAFKPVRMRMEVLRRADGTILVNDAYNANPSSMRASIESICRSYPQQSRWLVLGDMRELGSISQREHESLGRWIAGQSVDHVFLYGRDTRFVLRGISAENPKQIVERYRKKRQLVDALNQRLREGIRPVILFKASRSIKLEQVSHALLSSPS